MNAARGDLPAFRLVDVPGLGYAEAEAGVQDSWRALLERYTSVRSSLAAVFHLVDSRHQVTPTDKQVIYLWLLLVYTSFVEFFFMLDLISFDFTLVVFLIIP